MIWSNFSSAAPDLWLIGRANAALPERARGLPKVDGSLKQDGYASFFDDVANALLGDGGHGMPDAEGKRRTIARRDLRGRFIGLAEKAALLRVTHPIGYAYDGGEGDLCPPRRRRSPCSRLQRARCQGALSAGLRQQQR